MKNIKTIIAIVTMGTAPMTFAGGANDHMHHDMHGAGGAHSAGAHWMSPAAEQKRQNPVEATPSSLKKGAQLFQQNCVSCHGTNAEGDGPAAMALNPKPSNLRAMSGGHPDGDFAWKISNGRGAMPAWAALGDENIWHLVNFIQNLKQQPVSGNPSDTNHGDGHAHGH